MARQEELDALQIKLDEMTVELSAAKVEIDTLNTCKLSVQNQFISVKKSADNGWEEVNRKTIEIRQLKDRIKLKDENILDLLQNKEL